MVPQVLLAIELLAVVEDCVHVVLGAEPPKVCVTGFPAVPAAASTGLAASMFV